MVQYIYKTEIGYQDSTNRIDFETYYKETSKEFSDLLINDTSFILELEYTNFKALIDGTIIKWEDVRYISSITNGNIMYELYLISNSAL